jgi:hypothetical protein
MSNKHYLFDEELGNSLTLVLLTSCTIALVVMFIAPFIWSSIDSVIGFFDPNATPIYDWSGTRNPDPFSVSLSSSFLTSFIILLFIAVREHRQRKKKTRSYRK